MNGALIRNNGLGGTEYGVAWAVRRTVQPEHVRFVAANRHRMGWQTMATICGVNVADLRRHCEAANRGLAPEPEPRPAPTRPATGAAARGSSLLAALKAIQGGANCVENVMDVLGLSRSSAGELVGELRACGWMAGDARTMCGWIVTDAGAAALRAPNRALAARRILRPGTVQLAMLQLAERGGCDRHRAAAALGISVGSAGSTASALARLGLMLAWTPTPAGREELARHRGGEHG